jgi:hypothetical protein
MTRRVFAKVMFYSFQLSILLSKHAVFIISGPPLTSV